MDRKSWQFGLAVPLIALTIALYALRWVLFPGWAFHNEMWRFLVGDIAFLFLQVVLVSLFIDRVMQRRERDEMRRKLNMVIGAFFSEMGTELLGRIASLDTQLDTVRDRLVPQPRWSAADYASARVSLRGHHAAITLPTEPDLLELKRLLLAEKPFLLGLLGNQSLLEHESFTELLWAVTHLAEELDARRSLADLETPDAVHLAGDIKRVYGLLVEQWLEYLEHLHSQYPYLFSLAVRTNPLDADACATVKA